MSTPKLATGVRREQIAQAALDLVAAHGVRGLSIAAVARRVGLVPSGIYRHFRNKEEMLSALLSLVEKRLVEIVERAVAASDDPLEQLHAIVMRHIQFIREGRAIPRILFSGDAHDEEPARRRRILDLITKYVSRIMGVIARGQAGGRIRREVDPETAAMLLLGIVVPAGIRWHMTDGQFDVTRHARRAWPMFLAAVEARPGSDG